MVFLTGIFKGTDTVIGRNGLWNIHINVNQYVAFVPCFSSTVWFIIVSVMLYASSLAYISCFMYSGLYAWKLLSPMVYFSFLNEDSMDHLALYKVLIRSAGNSFLHLMSTFLVVF